MTAPLTEDDLKGYEDHFGVDGPIPGANAKAAIALIAEVRRLQALVPDPEPEQEQPARSAPKAGTEWAHGVDREGRRWFVQSSNVREEGPSSVVLKSGQARDEALPCGQYHDGAGHKARARADLRRHCEGKCSCYAASASPETQA